MSSPSPPPLSELLARAGLRPKRSWGQNFLHDHNILRAIAELVCATPAGEANLPVLEFGAGLGVLTWFLAASGANVVAIERDRELIPTLRQNLGWATNLEIVEANAATIDYAAMRRRFSGNPQLRVAGNLPYQLSGRIIGAIADVPSDVARAVFMVQLEVGERLMAPPGGRSFGLLSALVQRNFSVRQALKVGPEAFIPPPRVNSCVLVFEPLETPVAKSHTADRLLVGAAKAAFSNRRKTLRKSLANGLRVSPGVIDEVFSVCTIDPRARAETLSPQEFLKLGQALGDAGLL